MEFAGVAFLTKNYFVSIVSTNRNNDIDTALCFTKSCNQDLSPAQGKLSGRW